MPHTVWVANGKGGVGKSMLTMVLACLYETHGRPLRLIDADDKAKLAEFVGEDRVLSMRIGASAEELRINPALAYSYWDRLAEEIIQHDTGVDLGANMDRQVLAWAEKSSLGAFFNESDVSMDFYVPVTADPLALSGGIGVLATAERVFPNARRVLVLNKMHGPFDAYAEAPEFQEIAAMRDRGLYIVEMDHCVSEAWTDFERLKLPPARVVALSAKDLAQQTGLGILAARRALGDYASWLKRLQLALEPLLRVRATHAASHGTRAAFATGSPGQ